jgi:hypothetical protein
MDNNQQTFVEDSSTDDDSDVEISDEVILNYKNSGIEEKTDIDGETQGATHVETEGETEGETEVKKKPGRPRGANYKERVKSQPTESTDKIISENNDTIVVLRNRRKPAKKKKIIVYREDIQEDKPIEIEVKSKRGRGRPKAQPVIEQVNQEEKIEIERFVQPKEPTEKELRKLELQNKLLETEQIAGRKLRLNKKGKVDGRMVRERSEAQINATKKMLEAKKIQREIKKREQSSQHLIEIDDSVKQMVASLSKAKQQVQQEVAPVPPPKPVIDLSIFG